MRLEEGMLVKLKSDLSSTFRQYGTNRCKRNMAGQLRIVHSKTISSAPCVLIRRTIEERKKYLWSITFWYFSKMDIELIDIESIEKTRKEEIGQLFFDIEQLVV